MRPCNVDRSSDVWAYRPQSHKTEHHGRERVIYIGPKGQQLLTPYLVREDVAFCFAPAESEQLRNSERRANRLSPMTPSQATRLRRGNSRGWAGTRAGPEFDDPMTCNV